MSLWRFNGRKLIPVDLTSSDIGADVYLCCPGPSLAMVDETKLHVSGASVVCMNTAYPRIRRPDCWIGSDLPGCFAPDLWFQSFMKIGRVAFADESIGGRPLKTFPNSFFADLGSGDTLDILAKRAPDTFFVWPDSTLTFVLHVLLWMGTKRLFLVGCDFGGTDYYDDRKLPADLRDENQRLYRNQANEIGRLAQAARPMGIHIVSCTENSRANQFIAYLPLDKALAQTAARNTGPTWTPRHVRDVERDRWAKRFARTARPSVERGVLVGVPGDQADLVEGWWRAYSAQNRLPVAFVDYGLSADARRWCENHGTVVDHQAPQEVKGWFRKPLGILRSPFQLTLVLDVDCYPTASVDLLFAQHVAGRVEVALDRYADHAERKVPSDTALYDTGALLVEWDSPALVDWAATTVIDRYDARGDQEVFSLAVKEKGWAVEALPEGAFDAWFALEGKPAPLLVHWCGEGGKAELRKQHPPPTPAIVTTPAVHKTLIDFWHGLGDNIMCLPAIRKFKAETGDFVGLAMARCHAPASLHDGNRAVDCVHYLNTPWDHHAASGRPLGACYADTHAEAELIATRCGYDRVIHVDLDNSPNWDGGHKLLSAAKQLGVSLLPTEHRTSYQYDRELAGLLLDGTGIVLPERYVFLHREASTDFRSIPRGLADAVCERIAPGLPIIRCDEIVKADRSPIALSAEMIAKATAVVTCDSVMGHLATAMGKKVDLIWYKERRVYEMVKPLFPTDNNVVIGLAALMNFVTGTPGSDDMAACCQMLEGAIS